MSVSTPTHLIKLIRRVLRGKLRSQFFQFKHELGLELFFGEALLAMRPPCFVDQWLDRFTKFDLCRSYAVLNQRNVGLDQLLLCRSVYYGAC